MIGEAEFWGSAHKGRDYAGCQWASGMTSAALREKDNLADL